MAAHGLQKVIMGPAAFGQMMLAGVGVPLPTLMAYVVTFVELVGGVLLILGLFSRLAALLLTINLIVAILLVKVNVGLIAPSKTSKKRERHPWPRWMTRDRRRIETVASQLVERYRIKRVWARDAWHLTSRFLWKLLSHSCAVLLCQRAGLSPLRFSELIIH